MFKKSVLMVLSVFMVLIVFMGSVSAAEDMQTAINDEVGEPLTSEVSSAGIDDNSGLEELEIDNDLSLENSLNKGIDESAQISISNDNTQYTEPPTETFTSLNTLISQASDNDIITLPCNYKFTSGIDDSLTDGIAINQNNIIINGEGCTIDASGLSRIFQITGENVTINNINFINGKLSSGGNGAALIWSGDKGKLYNCSFVNNARIRTYQAMVRQYGGAIYWSGKDGTVFNCSFVNNTVEDVQYIHIYVGGSAIGWTGVNGTIFNCSFVNNTGVYAYGAIDFVSADGSVFNCSFVNNTSNYGAAIRCGDQDVAVFNCSFVNNTAGSGGAIYYDADHGSVFNCSFVNNTAGNGGAIFWQSYADYGSVFNCSFENNTADRYGGAIYWWYSDHGSVFNCSFVGNNLTVTSILVTSGGGAIYWYGPNGSVFNCSFEDNYAKTNGASIYLDSNAQNGSVANCSFVNCSTGWGVIYVTGDYVSVANCSFVNNTATHSCSIHWNGINGTVFNCSFENNTGPCHWQGSNGSLANCSFVNNTDKYEGGAITWTGENGIISNSSFMDNRAPKGGAIDWLGQYGIIDNCSFVNNTAIEDGGGAMTWGGINGTISNCSFVNNTAIKGGGAVWIVKSYELIYDMSENTVIYNSSFVNNAAHSGGAVKVENLDASIVNCSFVNNTAEGHGGALHHACSNITVADSSFENNTAIGQGGAIYMYNAQIICEYEQEIIPEFCFYPGETTSIYNSSFENNTASNGGAIFFTLNDPSFLEEQFGENYEYYISVGVVFHVTPGSNEAVISLSSFTNNSARDFNGDGGAIYLYGNGSVSDSSFVNNSARAGGAIYLDGNGSISDSYLIDNKVLSTALYGTKDNKLLYITFEGNENYTNAIYASGTIDFDNVTYWNGSEVNSDDNALFKAVQEIGINITLEVYGPNDELVDNITLKTNENGQIIYDYSNCLNCHYKAYHLDDTYYTYIETMGVFDKGYDIIVLNNQTYYSLNGTAAILNATIKDMLNNTIVADGVELFFILPNGSRIEASCDEDGIWTAQYTFSENGNYSISAEVVPASFNYEDNTYMLNKVFDGTIVVYSPSLTVRVISNNPEVRLGEPASFTIVVKNDGYCELSEISVVNVFPDGLIYTGFDGSSWSKVSSALLSGAYRIGLLWATNDWSQDGNKFTYSGTLKPGESANYTLHFDTTKLGTFTVDAVASSNMTCGAYANNSTVVYDNGPGPSNETDNSTDSGNGGDSGSTPEEDSSTDSSPNPDELSMNDVSQSAAVEKTGNPLLVLLLAVFACLPTLRRKE